MTDNKNKPLTLDERRIIETGIRNGSKKTAIADTIDKDKSTVDKEIRLHRTLSHKCHLPLECSTCIRNSKGASKWAGSTRLMN